MSWKQHSSEIGWAEGWMQGHGKFLLGPLGACEANECCVNKTQHHESWWFTLSLNKFWIMSSHSRGLIWRFVHVRKLFGRTIITKSCNHLQVTVSISLSMALIRWPGWWMGKWWGLPHLWVKVANRPPEASSQPSHNNSPAAAKPRAGPHHENASRREDLLSELPV